MKDPQARFEVLEAVIPNGLVYDYTAVLADSLDTPVILQAGTFNNRLLSDSVG